MGQMFDLIRATKTDGHSKQAEVILISATAGYIVDTMHSVSQR